jgi:hypothetical protein
MVLAEQTQSQGKCIILVASGNKTDTNRQNFAFTSYLLISNGMAAFRYADEDYYGEVWLYNNYSVDLGMPLGARYQIGTSWRRDFTRAFVIVDPVNRTATISTSPVIAPTATTAPTQVPIATPTRVPNTSVPSTPTTAVWEDGCVCGWPAGPQPRSKDLHCTVPAEVELSWHPDSRPAPAEAGIFESFQCKGFTGCIS